MVIVGLTGSIAMGKSTVGAMFAELGVPVFGADDAVRDFYSGPNAQSVERMFPGVMMDGRVDRDRLARVVLNDPAALVRLESLVHPAVREARSQFVTRSAGELRQLAIVDVPLLFETGGESEVDLIVVVSAPEAVQRTRALEREGMTEAKLKAILARQTGDRDKRGRAHFVIDTSGSLACTRAQVRQFLRAAGGLDGARHFHA